METELSRIELQRHGTPLHAAVLFFSLKFLRQLLVELGGGRDCLPPRRGPDDPLKILLDVFDMDESRYGEFLEKRRILMA